MGVWVMGKFDWAKIDQNGGDDSGGNRGGQDPRRAGPPPLPHKSLAQRLALLALAAIVLYAGYFWTVRRVVVPAGKVLVLLKKNGTRSLAGDQIVVPRAP